MKRRMGTHKRGKIDIWRGAAATVAVVLLLIPIFNISARSLYIAAAGSFLPEGGFAALINNFSYEENAGATPYAVPGPDADDELPAIPEMDNIAMPEYEETISSEPPDIPKEQKGQITEMEIAKTGASYGNVYIKNSTGKEINIAEYLKAELNMEISKTGEPQVLIYHTHTTEAFLTYDAGFYDKASSFRSMNDKRSIVSVGTAICEQLESAGIGVIHDIKVYDSPTYKGAYSRSAKSIKNYLEKHPSIKVILDIHRDSMTQSGGVKIKPTKKINGQKAAQIMILAGCETKKSLPNPNWKENLKFAVKLQKQIEDDYPGLTRPINFMVAQYNQQYSTGALLIEIGTEANTIDEAVYTGKLFGDSLVRLLSSNAGRKNTA